MSERQDPDNFSCFPTQEWCARDLLEIDLKIQALHADK